MDASKTDEWKPIETAPRDGTEILVRVVRAGLPGTLVAHWAEGGGEDQPRFGPNWFYWTGWQFGEIHAKPTHWAPIPSFAGPRQ